jgi:uncharacterized protein YjbI with pentapeptide repeats
MLALLLGPVAWLATPAKSLRGAEKVNATNSTRQVLLTAVGGIALIAGLAFTARTYQLTRRGQLSDRYNKGIGLLASEKLTERLGGIYALEQVMRESEEEHETVVHVLAAFIRDRSPRKEAPATDTADAAPVEAATGRQNLLPTKSGPPADVQAAVTVIGRRPKRFELHRIDLRGVDLSHVQLAYSRLDEVLFMNAVLVGVDFFRANLSKAVLAGADLRDATLEEANLAGSHLDNANLNRASVGKANLRNAHLGFSTWVSASLMGSDLRNARMYQCDLTSAFLYRTDLRSAYMMSAKLNNAQLGGANLADACLEFADVQGASFIDDPGDEQEPEPVIGLTPQQLAKAEFGSNEGLSEDFLHETDACRVEFRKEQEEGRKRLEAAIAESSGPPGQNNETTYEVRDA